MRLVLCVHRTLSPKPNQTLKYVVLHIMVYCVLRIIHPPSPWPKAMWEGIYIIVSATLYHKTAPCTVRSDSRQANFSLLALRKADFGIPAETVSYVCRSLVAVLQQASLFLEICRHMALPDQDHAIFCQ